MNTCKYRLSDILNIVMLLLSMGMGTRGDWNNKSHCRMRLNCKHRPWLIRRIEIVVLTRVWMAPFPWSAALRV